MKNIFVIDPSIMIHKIIELTFQNDSEYNIRFFSSYPINVDEGEKAEYIFITIDLSGVEIEEAIKELKERFKCNVIAMVPKFLDYNREAIINAGADSILEKPFTSDQLKTVLASLSDSVALKEETIAEIDSETFEDIGSFDEELTLSEADLLEMDREILEQDVSGEEAFIEGFEDDTEEEPITSAVETEDSEKAGDGDIEFDEKALEEELEEELADVDFSEEELEKDLESMDLSSIEEEAEEFEAEEEPETSELDNVSAEETQKIEPAELESFRKMAQEIDEQSEEKEFEEKTVNFEEQVSDTETVFEEEVASAEEAVSEPEVEFEGEGGEALEEFMAEESEDAFEDLAGEEVKEDIDFERPLNIEEVKPEEALEAGAEEADFFEQSEEQGEMPIESAVEEAGDFFEKAEEVKGDLVSESAATVSQFAETVAPAKEEESVAEVKEEVKDEIKETVARETAPLTLTDEDIERIANKVIEKLSDKIIREIAWEVIPQLAEEIVLRRIKELEKEIE